MIFKAVTCFRMPAGWLLFTYGGKYHLGTGAGLWGHTSFNINLIMMSQRRLPRTPPKSRGSSCFSIDYGRGAFVIPPPCPVSLIKLREGAHTFSFIFVVV